MRLSDHLEDIRDHARRAGRVWVGCDFDGTLSHLVDDPWAAAVDPRSLAALARLAANPAVGVAVISGRALGDLRSRVALTGVALAGNHGAEIDAPGLRLVDPTAAAVVRALDAAHRRLAASEVATTPGVTLDHKTYSLAVDYRAVADEDRPSIRAAVAEAAGGFPELHFQHGLNGSEIRAAGGWNKGSAASRLWPHQSGRDALPVFLGDDRTDEDAFAALPDGVTVCVGDHPTLARYRLPDPTAVADFLDWLATVCEEIRAPTR